MREIFILTCLACTLMACAGEECLPTSELANLWPAESFLGNWEHRSEVVHLDDSASPWAASYVAVGASSGPTRVSFSLDDQFLFAIAVGSDEPMLALAVDRVLPVGGEPVGYYGSCLVADAPSQYPSGEGVIIYWGDELLGDPRAVALGAPGLRVEATSFFLTEVPPEIEPLVSVFERDPASAELRSASFLSQYLLSVEDCAEPCFSAVATVRHTFTAD
ncbi:MAG: hypothetical protein DRJ42_25340 [Deltaproteobacteria bacterium]|nr:MAG: hypothetical protein DRJ42_25340 [Deltaproteobacteria bacterium]